MQWLAALCVKRPVFATVLILSLTVIGTFSFTRLGVDRFPKIDFPTVLVTTAQPGAAPEHIETEISDKIEGAGMDGGGQVLILGERQGRWNVRLDADRLSGYTRTVTDVAGALQGRNCGIPGGHVDQGAESLTLRTRGRVSSAAAFNGIVV